MIAQRASMTPARPAVTGHRSIPALALTLLLAACAAPSPDPPAEAEQASDEDVPRNIDEAHAALLRMLPPGEIARMKAGTERDMVLYHHGLGTWLRNEWGLWRGSPLQSSLRHEGFVHPDDMSGVILDAFWCRVQGRGYDLGPQVAFYEAFWVASAAGKTPNLDAPSACL